MQSKDRERIYLEEGAEGLYAERCLADLITVDLRQPHIYPSNNYTTAILDTMSGRDVADSIVAGRLVMRDRNVLTLDEEEILGKCAQHMLSIRQRMLTAG